MPAVDLLLESFPGDRNFQSNTFDSKNLIRKETDQLALRGAYFHFQKMPAVPLLIRFERGEQKGNTITLRYYVEIKKYPGKESADVKGYNYTKDEIYKIPNDVKLINIQLYEDRIDGIAATNPKLIAEQTFNFFEKSRHLKTKR